MTQEKGKSWEWSESDGPCTSVRVICLPLDSRGKPAKGVRSRSFVAVSRSVSAVHDPLLEAAKKTLYIRLRGY